MTGFAVDWEAKEQRRKGTSEATPQRKRQGRNIPFKGICHGPRHLLVMQTCWDRRTWTKERRWRFKERDHGMFTLVTRAESSLGLGEADQVPGTRQASPHSVILLCCPEKSVTKHEPSIPFTLNSMSSPIHHHLILVESCISEAGRDCFSFPSFLYFLYLSFSFFLKVFFFYVFQISRCLDLADFFVRS
jgi:hypothetical protein